MAAECRVGLETAHNVLIDFLWAKGYTQVYVIPPNVGKGIRGRYTCPQRKCGSPERGLGRIASVVPVGNRAITPDKAEYARRKRHCCA
jgi:hypothetical protein